MDTGDRVETIKNSRLGLGTAVWCRPKSVSASVQPRLNAGPVCDDSAVEAEYMACGAYISEP